MLPAGTTDVSMPVVPADSGKGGGDCFVSMLTRVRQPYTLPGRVSRRRSDIEELLEASNSTFAVTSSTHLQPLPIFHTV